MGSPAILRSIGHFVNVLPAAPIATAIDMGSLSAGAGLIVTTTGVVIDTQRNPGATGNPPVIGLALYRKPMSCKVVIPFRYGLASGVSWAVAGLLRHSTASGGTYATLATLNTKTVSKVGATTTVANGAYAASETDVDLTGAGRYIRVRMTVTGSATTTGSILSRGMPVIVFNADQTPATSTGARG